MNELDLHRGVRVRYQDGNGQQTPGLAHPPHLGKEKIQGGISSNREPVTGSTLVKNLEGFVGKLWDVVIDAETDELTHIIVQQGLYFPEYLEIPIVFVENVGDDSIFVSLSHEELDTFLLPTDVIYQ